ncbi:type II toxin-antitoxin system VapB family antitoxin [Aureimonas pseudogalii]|uniref:Antitoxin VapB n=1 Tax=Aureimonas pseudogalii TaxID=1744844 RepID=A0A7W6H7H6_9HYPH|nr:type II toxin-antitoxin system VapB family antitoxin [Aureimonas pseudogalii]MBB3999878.1 antitoxin VapB [Aureimonas pseudogalii]
MALYIKDAEVDALADELKRLTKASTKAEAVRASLKRSVDEARAQLPIRQRLAKTLAMAKAAGPYAPGDHKAETDDMWGDQ